MRNVILRILIIMLSGTSLHSFAGGDGSSSNPFQVSTLIELQVVKTFPGSHFILIDDIDATDTQTWNGGAGFDPIGTSTIPFLGTFDGQGYSIDNLYIDRSTVNNNSLFGYTNGAVISNVMLTNCNITGDGRTAALAGYLINSTVTACGSTGSVNSYSAGGGLVGRMSVSTIIDCFSAVNVSGTGNGNFFGGLVGATESNCTIKNCFARGSVTGNDRVGGLVGTLSEALLECCYSTGAVNCSNEDSGGLVGNVSGTYTANYCFWDTETSNKGSSPVGTGKTTAEMKYFYMYHGDQWDFVSEWSNGVNDYWDMDFDGVYNNGYPYLAWQDGDDNSIANPEGNGTGTTPYLIEDLFDLFWLSANRDKWSASFLQTADIDAEDTVNWNGGQGFSPIGTGDSGFHGDYNGDGHSIENLFIDRTTDYVALFGRLDMGTCQGVNLIDADVSGNENVGAIAGMIYHYSSVENCSSTGNVTGSMYVGGLAGVTQFSSQVGFCFSNADVYSPHYVGGFLGYNGNSSTITNCYSNGYAQGATYVGGFTGRNNSTISNCYSTGNVSGTSTTGGFTGFSGTNVTGCFWDIDTSGQTTSACGTGLHTADMQTLSIYLDAGWDFIGESINGAEDIWILLDNEYPSFNPYTGFAISEVSDVLGDQGHQLKLRWVRSDQDICYNPNRLYTIWRLEEDLRSLSGDVLLIDDPMDYMSREGEDLRPVVLHSRDEYWTFIETIPASAFPEYMYVAPTLVDSSAVLDPGDYMSSFMILFYFEYGYLRSNIASGYSVDNIAPYGASGVTLAFDSSRTDSALLSWNEVTEGGYNGNSYPEENGIWYRIYSSDHPDFVCNESTLIQTTQDTSIDVDPAGAERRFYNVVVSDQP